MSDMSEIIVEPIRYKSAKSLLKAARKLIAKGNWGKGSYLNPRTGAFCALGAIYISYFGLGKNAHYHWVDEVTSESDFPSVSKAIIALDEIAHTKYWGSMIAYNDTLGTTKEDVLAVFDEAIGRV